MKIGASFYAYIYFCILHICFWFVCIVSVIRFTRTLLFFLSIRRQHHYQFKRTFALLERGFIFIVIGLYFWFPQSLFMKAPYVLCASFQYATVLWVSNKWIHKSCKLDCGLWLWPTLSPKLAVMFSITPFIVGSPVQVLATTTTVIIVSNHCRGRQENSKAAR